MLRGITNLLVAYGHFSRIIFFLNLCNLELDNSQGVFVVLEAIKWCLCDIVMYNITKHETK